MIADPSNSFFDRKEVWALIGIALAFVLTEIGKYFHSALNRRSLRKSLFDELEINYHLLNSKKEIINKMASDVKNKRIRPGISVPTASAIYDNNTAAIIQLLKPIERDVIQNIYARMRILDNFLFGFESNLVSSLKDKISTNPWQAYAGMLSDHLENCDVIQRLIDSLRNKEPIDIYKRKALKGK
jgi:hypothetical protein